MTSPTRSEEPVHEVLNDYRPLRAGTERRLIEVGRAAVESSPSTDRDRPLARAAMSIELRELERLDSLVDRLVLNK